MDFTYVTDDIRVDSLATDIGLKIGENWYSVRKLIEKQMWIIDKNKKAGLLTLNYAQERLFFEICKCLRDGKECNFIILKARQLGFTTFISAFLFVMTMFRANQEAVIIANTQDNASKIFEKYKYYYNGLKEHNSSLAPTLQNKTGNMLVTKETHCSLRIAPATQDAVRGTTITGFHGSEVGFWNNIDDILAAAKSALPTHSINPVTFLFLESTANGQNSFKDYWDDACSNRGEEGSYIPLFFPRFENKEYRERYSGFTLTPFEEDMKTKYNLDLEQIAFFRKVYLGFKRNLQLTLQEYPFCPSDAFMTSGSGAFDNYTIAKVKDVARNYERKCGFFKYDVITNSIDDFQLKNCKFISSNAGHCFIYELPQEGVPYVIGVDMAVGMGNDDSVAQVIRNDTKKQVAIMYSNSLTPEKFSIDVCALGKLFNTALISPETAFGSTIINILKKFNYPNIYKRTGDDTSVGENYLEFYGFKTTSITKPNMIDNMRAICADFDEPYMNIVDYDTLCEMETFVYEYKENSDKVKIKGSGSKHDDKVMALAIAYYTSEQQTTLINKKEIIKPITTCWELQEDTQMEVEDVWGSVYL